MPCTEDATGYRQATFNIIIIVRNVTEICPVHLWLIVSRGFWTIPHRHACQGIKTLKNWTIPSSPRFTRDTVPENPESMGTLGSLPFYGKIVSVSAWRTSQHPLSFALSLDSLITPRGWPVPRLRPRSHESIY